MPAVQRPFSSWCNVIERLQVEPIGTVFRVPMLGLPHPAQLPQAFVAGMGLPVGQKADFRATLTDGTALHVREFEDAYYAHLDQVSPHVAPLEHLRVDAPKVYIAVGAGAGGLAGLLLGRSTSVALRCSLYGAAIAGLLTLF
jgi:hypothetical protein